MYSKRVDCIVNNLKKEKAIERVNKSSFFELMYINGTHINIDDVMTELEPLIDSANFGCTILGFFAIILICVVLFVVVICVACLHKQ
jgi:signal transduction histidine kinase